MFKSGTPDLSLNLSSPWSKRKSRSTADSPLDSVDPNLAGDTSSHNSHSNSGHADESISKSSNHFMSKNPLKSIKKLTRKNDDEIDTRDYYSASPNLNFGNSLEDNNNSGSLRPGLNSLRSPNISLQMFRSGENLSGGLENMPFGVYELQKYGIVGNIQTLAFDPIQSLMAVVTNLNKVYILGQSRVNVTLSLDTISPIRALKFIKGVYLIAIDSSNSISVISLLNKKVLHTCISKVPITSFACDYSLEFVYVGLKNGCVKAFNIESGMETILNLNEQQSSIFRLEGNKEVMSLSIHPRDIGTLLISYPRVTSVYNLVENRVVQNLIYKLPKTAPGGENSMYEYDLDGLYYPKTLHNVWHPNGLHCVTVHVDNSIVFWDAKTGEKILARTLFDSDIDQPSGRPQKIQKNRMTKIKTIKWLCEENPEKTSLLILGGDGYASDGYHQLVRMDFGKMISYSLSSYAHMAKYYALPKEQRIFAIHSTSSIVDFIPLGEASPYFDGCHGAKLISVIMNDGSMKFLHYPEGHMMMKAKYFPSTISWLNPKITCSSSSYLDRRILNSIATVKKADELPDSILRGGIPCRPKYKADAGSLIITGHENGFIRLWDSSEGDLDSNHVFEIDVSELLKKDDESVSVENISFAPETLEIAASLHSGDVLLFAYQMNKNYQPKVIDGGLSQKLESLSLENSGRALINIQDRTPPSLKKGFLPKLLIKTLDNGPVTAVTTSNIGIVAIGYQSGRLLLVDRRSGAVIHNEILKDKGLNITTQATSIQFGYGIHSMSNNRGTVLLYVGTNIGRLLTFEIAGLPGSFRTKLIEQVDSNDEAIVSIIVINSETGRPAEPVLEHLKRDISSDRVVPFVIASSHSDIRVVKNNSKVAHKTYNKGNISKVGITGAKSPTTGQVAFCLVIVLGSSKEIVSLTLPSLTEISNLRIPYRIESKFATESSILPLGDVLLRVTETEAALVNIMKIRTPIMSLETGKSADTLFLKNITVPWRPGANPMLKTTPSVSYPQLYILLTGRDRAHKAIGSEEGALSWEVSCYNPANYTYISSSKPIYYNPNAIHQDAQLMETPKRLQLKGRTGAKKAAGWLDNITNYANSTVETAQNNMDSYLGDLNDDFDKMLSDAKSDAIKSVIGGKLF
jgi:syntaxin-binding protein 5